MGGIQDFLAVAILIIDTVISYIVYIWYYMSIILHIVEETQMQ